MDMNAESSTQTENGVVRTEQDGKNPFPNSGISGIILALVFVVEIHIYPFAIYFECGNIDPDSFFSFNGYYLARTDCVHEQLGLMNESSGTCRLNGRWVIADECLVRGDGSSIVTFPLSLVVPLPYRTVLLYRCPLSGTSHPPLRMYHEYRFHSLTIRSDQDLPKPYRPLKPGAYYKILPESVGFQISMGKASGSMPLHSGSGEEEVVNILLQMLRLDFLLPTSIQDDWIRRIGKEAVLY